MAKVLEVHIAITFTDDTVGIMGFVVAEYGADGAIRWSKEPTPENINAEIARTAFDAHKFPIKGWRGIERSELPQDREYRDAWVDDGKAITHDMNKARDLCMKRLRQKRNEKLDALDKDWMRASGQKNVASADAVESKRQELRDFPSTIAPVLEAAQDIEALKAIALPE